MDWKTVADNVFKLKNLADNEEIKSNLEALRLYNCRFKQMPDGDKNSPESISAARQESELKDNTLAKIYEIQKQARQAQTRHEEASKLIECFLYIDNYLSLYAEPELFFMQKNRGVYLCDSAELLNSKTKCGSIAQSLFFFQELNEKAHSSVRAMCGFLKESKENISDFIDQTDYACVRLDSLNDSALKQEQPDKDLDRLYPFILIINYTAQKLLMHRFAGIYPSNLNKKILLEALKQKEHALDRIRNRIIKRAFVIRQLKEKITAPMNQAVWFDERCVEILNEEAVAKREEPERKGEAASLLLTKDKISKCCEAAYWLAFLMANDKKTPSGEKNSEADEWFSLYLETAKNNGYEMLYSIRKLILKNKAANAKAFNAIKIKPIKPVRKEKEFAFLKKTVPLWLAGVIASALAAAFIYFIISSAKSIAL